MALPAEGVYAQQTFPARPIRMIVPAAFGDGPDPTARMLARKLTETFNQPVVVDNRPGDGGTIGAEIAVRASADGYTVIVVPSSYGANAAFHKLPYDSLKDVTPIALIGETGFVVTLHLSVSVTNIKELIAYDKASSDKLRLRSGKEWPRLPTSNREADLLRAHGVASMTLSNRLLEPSRCTVTCC